MFSGRDETPAHRAERSKGVGDDDERATTVADEEVTQESFEMIKARTMYEMVDEIGPNKQKMLFITNNQADLLAKSEEPEGESAHHYSARMHRRSTLEPARRVRGGIRRASRAKLREATISVRRKSVL